MGISGVAILDPQLARLNEMWFRLEAHSPQSHGSLRVRCVRLAVYLMAHMCELVASYLIYYSAHPFGLVAFLYHLSYDQISEDLVVYRDSFN